MFTVWAGKDQRLSLRFQFFVSSDFYQNVEMIRVFFSISVFQFVFFLFALFNLQIILLAMTPLGFEVVFARPRA